VYLIYNPFLILICQNFQDTPWNKVIIEAEKGKTYFIDPTHQWSTGSLGKLAETVRKFKKRISNLFIILIYLIKNKLSDYFASDFICFI
jgi:hypothetical protein